ncbi:hypothetical protein KTH89_22345, partial [Lachnospiraceae bacterium ASD5720]|nr:hypothetical protein [Diplocloster agilis]
MEYDHCSGFFPSIGKCAYGRKNPPGDRTQCCQLKIKKVLDKVVKMCSEAINYKIIDCEGVL